NEDLFRLKFPLAPGETESPPVVTISLMDPSNGRLRWNCTVCESLCVHVGAAFSFILDEKMTLGLAAPPPERVPVESPSEQELIERAIEERRARARSERMIVKTAEPEQPWTDYAVSNTIYGKTDRVTGHRPRPSEYLPASTGVTVGRPILVTLRGHGVRGRRADAHISRPGVTRGAEGATPNYCRISSPAANAMPSS